MWTDKNGIMGVGYEGMDSDAFIQGLVVWKVETLIDVRLHPLSRKKGFSKRALSELLKASGIEYVHLPELGNPKDNRDGFARPATPEGLSAHSRYKELLQGQAAQEALKQVAKRALQERVALLCFEASERSCHRQFVLDDVKSRISALASF